MHARPISQRPPKPNHPDLRRELPRWVTVIRQGHAFEGRALEVMGQMRRDGLRLLLILPDGSRSLIPAEWTDLAVGQQPVAVDAPTLAPRNLGTLAELLQARAVVNALLDRLVPVRDGPLAAAARGEIVCN